MAWDSVDKRGAVSAKVCFHLVPVAAISTSWKWCRILPSLDRVRE